VKTAVVIVAAGLGTRAGGPIPKQYASLRGHPVLHHTLQTFLALAAIDAVQVVIGAGDHERYGEVAPQRSAKLLPPVVGGASRQASVLAGLLALEPHAPEHVLIHDAVRPFVDAATIARVLTALAAAPGVVPAVPVADTLKRADAHGRVCSTVDRSGLWRAQTPQGFHFPMILAAHRAASGRTDLSDDAAVAEWAGHPVTLVAGTVANRKLTTAEDLAQAQAGFLPDVRTGMGFDVHRTAPGDHVWLCGIRIPHRHGLEGHSDADVALHALTDALLGSIGEGDIGEHFPPSDERWKGAASEIFLREAARRVRRRAGTILNVDVTILCEAPKIAPFREQMRARIAAILGIDLDRTAVKATTTEGLGFPGRGEGIAAMATATVGLRVSQPA
jgi:2-C-methyl-D-erythritol 4-phosphate cytidylyltransferase/2-C-methyl-D-erythritol 2,4-cyclodiphosphate synthase